MSTPPNPGDVWRVANIVALWLAMMTAVLLARRRTAHVPVAVYLVALFWGDVARLALGHFVLSHDGPYTGGERVAYHVEQALYLIGPFGLAAAALLVLGNRSPWLAFALYGVAELVAVVCYPDLRRELLRSYYLAAELVGLAIVAGSLAVWMRRRRAPADVTPVDVTMIAVVSIAVADVVKLFGGPFHRGDFFGSWPLVWPMHVVLFVALAVLQGGAWWNTRG